jgi:hypothetical protein
MHDYHYRQPPSARVNGVIDLKHGGRDNNCQFWLDGEGFEWKRIHLPKARGRIDWVGNTVTITNLEGAFHGGAIAGHGFFDFNRDHGAAFRFHTALRQCDLRSLIAGVAQRTNKIEGLFSGDLTMTQADTHNLTNWQGRGWVTLSDGLIWDVPIFGIFSELVNGFFPKMGLGNSRARDAEATFQVTNSVIQTSDLEIHAGSMRVEYDGRVDFNGNVDGRMQAQMFGEIPVIAQVTSILTLPLGKIFEARITGTLDNPRRELVYIPSFMNMIKKLLEERPKTEPEKPAPPPGTPAPAALK